MNQVVLENWYNQPIHCPFCGSSLDKEGFGQCDHWLYQSYEGFFHWSARLRDALNETVDLDDTELSNGIRAKYKNCKGIIQAGQARFTNLVEYQLVAPNDIILVGFAPLDQELVSWGNEHVSPYDAKRVLS